MMHYQVHRYAHKIQDMRHIVSIGQVGILKAPLVHQICLVSHQDNDHITASLCPDLLNPAHCVQEGLSVCKCSNHASETTTSARAKMRSLRVPHVLETSYTTTATEESLI